MRTALFFPSAHHRGLIKLCIEGPSSRIPATVRRGADHTQPTTPSQPHPASHTQPATPSQPHPASHTQPDKSRTNNPNKPSISLALGFFQHMDSTAFPQPKPWHRGRQRE
jgi:hypothetical protein